MPSTTQAAFNLKRKSDGSLYNICTCGCGEPNNPPGATIFPSAEEAKAFVTFINSKDKPERYHAYGKLEGWYPAVHVDDTWKRREMDRFKTGAYHLPVWYDEKWFQDAKERVFDRHYPHVSMSDPEVIAFTDSPEKGMQDVQTKIKPGKFLQRFFGEVLTADEITKWAGKHTEEWSNGPELKLAKTPDEIERVYRMTGGFTSCMQKPVTMFQPLINPTRTYGAGDLAVAYITDKKGTKLLARALCWPEMKKVGRVYGDAPRLRAAIAKHLGFETKSDNSSYDTMEGARLLRIEYEGGFVVPYIDACGTHNNYVREAGEYLIITNGIGKHAGTQHGYVGNGKVCQKCGLAIQARYYKVHTNNSDFGIAKRWCHNCTVNYAKSIQHEEGRYYVDPRQIPVFNVAIYNEYGGAIAYQPTISHFIDEKTLVRDIFDEYYIKKEEAISVNINKFTHKFRLGKLVEGGHVYRSDFDGKYYYATDDRFRAVKVGKETWTYEQAQAHAKFNNSSMTWTDARSKAENLFDEPIHF